MSNTATPLRSVARVPFHADLLTSDEFVRMELDGKVELINGRLVSDTPTFTHHRLIAFFVSVLYRFAEDRELGVVLGSSMNVWVNRRTAFRPDVLFVSRERRGIIEELYLTEGPDIAIEVVSPSSRRRDYEDKRAGYEQIGTREYWIVDPLRSEARFYRRGDDGLLADVTPPAGAFFQSDVLSGFRLDPGVLFDDELPKVSVLLREMQL
jgi:Uma2 family endonuclease